MIIMLFDEIVAISTAYGKAAISVIRMSGENSIKMLNKAFKGKDLTKVKSHTINYGHIMSDKNEIIDEVMVSVFHAPKSFTSENMVEVSTHGGILVTNKVLERLLEIGFRLARPGEFSERAYLNGRIDLVQAEAVMDLIEARTNQALKIAHLGLNKESTKLVNNLQDKLLSIIAQIEVNIDYPEYDDAIIMSKEIIGPETKSLLQEINHIIKESEKNQLIREGVKTVIVGSPNVGKSSLLIAL
jgi:tRNA modification GTPase